MIVRNSFSQAFFSKSINSWPPNTLLILTGLLGIDRFVFETNIIKVGKSVYYYYNTENQSTGFLAKVGVKFRSFKINACARIFTLKTCFVRTWLVVLTQGSKYRYFKMFFYIKTCIPNHRGSYFVRGSIELYIHKYRVCSVFVKYLKMIFNGSLDRNWCQFSHFFIRCLAPMFHEYTQYTYCSV